MTHALSLEGISQALFDRFDVDDNARLDRMEFARMLKDLDRDGLQACGC